MNTRSFSEMLSLDSQKKAHATCLGSRFKVHTRIKEPIETGGTPSTVSLVNTVEWYTYFMPEFLRCTPLV